VFQQIYNPIEAAPNITLTSTHHNDDYEDRQSQASESYNANGPEAFDYGSDDDDGIALDDCGSSEGEDENIQTG
jgi:hypothetical protein